MDAEREYSRIATKLLEPDLEKYVKGKFSSLGVDEGGIVSSENNSDYNVESKSEKS